MADQAGADATAGIESLSFDEAVAELQRAVAELEAGGLPLERSLALYERGVALHERCAALLGQAELRVQRLMDRASGAVQATEGGPEDRGEGE
jgi:exodeoxyribonuclease VII small subunit